MKKIILATFYFLFFSCNTTQKNSSTDVINSWTEDEKDFIFKQCISWGLSSGTMDVERSNEYCYCVLGILEENFENGQTTIEAMEKNRDLRLLYEGC